MNKYRGPPNRAGPQRDTIGRDSSPKLRLTRPIRIAAVAAAAAAAAIAPAALGASQPRSHPHAVLAASASIATVTASGTTVTVTGHVRLRHATRAERRGVQVLVILADPAAHRERRTVDVAAGKAFSVSWTTSLSGHLVVDVRALVNGKGYGNVTTRMIYITPSTVSPPPPPPVGPNALVGTFKLDAGSEPSGQVPPTGSYFEILLPTGSPLPNISSPATNTNYTTLTPGTGGGFRTDAYQPAPTPSFTGGSFGGALANRIIAPVSLFLINFSVETAATDAQLGTRDPLPQIKNTGGKLSGQMTAWVLQWNGQSFNQGTPKPNGAVSSSTTALTGTYDSSTNHFTLDWRSLIVGGLFGGDTGVWHLTGTFVPASTSSH